MVFSNDPQAWATDLVTSIVRWGIEGAPLTNPINGEPLTRFKSAAEVAADYRDRASAVGLEVAIDELIEDQARWNAGAGFLTGLGGFTFLPMQLPASVTATWVIQTRMVGAIATLFGLDLDHGAVRTQILLTLVGEEAGAVLKQFGVKATQRFAQAQLRTLPAAALAQINRAVGFQLVSRAGQRSVVNLQHAIPVLGGLVGGGIDYVMTRRLGEFAAGELGRRASSCPGAPARGGSAVEEQVIDVEILR